MTDPEEIAQAYRAHADDAAETNKKWSQVTLEANGSLGPHPGENDDDD
ncbi:hypothetical protein KTS45_11200 [Halomicroarcula limicola]|uniref:Uncharacterized protein n=1 Tax=Haloarcula limicola TaxID=1429915 RepID=A0A8J7Y4T7_9EURY|nr:hypothetical protein [Halomicroarcula limicola]MBV0924765.1 hypothetical protein [Halomicroarcula limicola]